MGSDFREMQTCDHLVKFFRQKIDLIFVFAGICPKFNLGKPLRLIMNYLYDPASRQWKFYTDLK